MKYLMSIMSRVLGTEEMQIALEEQRTVEGITKFKNNILKRSRQGKFNETPYGNILIQIGLEAYTKKIQEWFDADLKSTSGKDMRRIKLVCDDAEVLAFKVLQIIIGSVLSDGRTTVLINKIRTALVHDFLYARVKEDNPKLYAYLGYEFARANSRERERLVKLNLKSLYDTYDLKSTEGFFRSISTLLQLLELSGANIITSYKAFYKGKQKVNFLRLTDEAHDIIASVDGIALAKDSIYKHPLIVPPRDWTGMYDGGYYVLRNRLVSTKSPLVAKWQEEQDYSRVLPIINKMQKVPWRVNIPIYEFIKHIFNNNIPLGGLPISIPTTWKDYMTMPTYEEGVSIPLKEWKTEIWAPANKKRQKITIELQAEHSRRMEVILNLGSAGTMKEYAKFYYVYQLDYRGRIYPTSSNFNMQQSSFVKAMLEFGEGQYLTPDGVWWLKIHIANTYGLDKQPYNERVQWVDDNYDTILKVANSPLESLSFLSGADSPFEFLAACMAFSDHLNGDKVYLPVQLDATCSGIQFYSGLLRDKVGAESVNVIGNNRNDIYQQVSNRAEEKLLRGEYDPIVTYKDSEGVAHTILTDATAISLRGNISRQLVKRPTMTVPYSVTKRGMQDQIRGELTGMEEVGKNFWSGEKWVASKLITELVSTSIYDIVDGARKGQQYLVQASKVLGRPATWYTPVYEYPVHQDSIDRNKKKVKTVYGEIILRKEGSRMDKRGHSNSIAPNVIHSLDSTVVLGVVDRADYNIGCIHDCFMVPPNSGYQVQEAYKEAFVEVMEADPLRHMQQQLDPEETIPYPEYGELDLDDVYKSEYIIS